MYSSLPGFSQKQLDRNLSFERHRSGILGFSNGAVLVATHHDETEGYGQEWTQQ